MPKAGHVGFYRMYKKRSLVCQGYFDHKIYCWYLSCVDYVYCGLKDSIFFEVNDLWITGKTQIAPHPENTRLVNLHVSTRYHKSGPTLQHLDLYFEVCISVFINVSFRRKKRLNQMNLYLYADPLHLKENNYVCPEKSLLQIAIKRKVIIS